MNNGESAAASDPEVDGHQKIAPYSTRVASPDASGVFFFKKAKRKAKLAKNRPDRPAGISKTHANGLMTRLTKIDLAACKTLASSSGWLG